MSDAVAADRRSFAPWSDPAARPVVHLAGVSKQFGGVAAVEQLSLDIFPGEFFALLGPSGCGKTTLLRLLAGFESADRGRIMLDGRDIGGVPPHRRPVNMMFQNYALFPHLSVFSNIAFGLRQEHLPKAEIAERVEAALALVQLKGLGARRPHQLSGGQRQRVALARSLVKRPRVLLLDEPLAALDQKLRQQTQTELMDLQRRLGLAFVIVTHDQEEAMTVADRIGVMNHGRLVQVGTPAEIYEKPNSRWVADFVGEINLVEGRVAARDGECCEIETPHGLRFRVLMPDQATRGETVWLALRPEKITISPAVAASHAGGLEGIVQQVGYRGGTSLYHVRLDNGLVLKAAAVNTAPPAGVMIAVADRATLAWPLEALVVLTQ